MMHNLRNHIGRCLLGLLLLFVASRGMRLPRETNTVWQHGKDASYEILRQLEKLDIKEPEVFNTTVQFPQPIECSDSCDPDSLATTNKTDGSNKESSSPVTKILGPVWQKGPLQNLTLWRLQSFGIVVARVFSHCASLY
ncbi:hypothetical protein JD844_011044 [Phrynosoma platyrhinos]|uniref:Uncharacterized protein n=1 Tax=Phrynosoma platyrhinos TaxID=52577 RepID=A0ABQ7THD6_PHRPL|nr:hypothetical protein JD844_011044 [Phrynosoma platyrhinos]